MQERQRSWSEVRDWTSCRVQASFHVPSVAMEWPATASPAMVASTGCTRNAVGSSAWKKDPDYRGTWCQGTVCPLDGRSQKEVQVGPDKLEVVASFCYLGDMLPAAGSCELSTTTRVITVWKKFKDLLPVLSSCHLSFKTRGRVYSSCMRSAMLHASETWPLTKLNLRRLQWNDRAMIRQICNVRPQDIVTTRSNELLVRLGIEDLDLILKERRLRWYGHVEGSNGVVKTAFDIQVDGKRGPGRFKMTWKQLTERDCREWKLSAINPHDRRTWRSGVQQASYLERGRGPTDVGCPCTCTFIKNLGPVVQSVISLTSSLRVISLTVLADSIYNILIFFAEKMWVAFAMQKLLTFFQQKISAYLLIIRCKF